MLFKSTDFVARPKVEQPHPNIFTFDLFKPALCAELLELAEGAPVEAPNSMNKYGTDLAKLVGTPWCRRLMETYVASIAADYYPECKKLRRPYGFLVRYAGGKQRALARHIDAPSAVTLNVCLGTKFTGGALRFHGPRGECFEVEHRVGQAIVHRGHHEHQALSITSGKRTNLILWCEA